MKYFIVCILVAISALTLEARMVPGDNSSTGLDRMKSLIGTWKGTDPKGNAVTVSYKFVSEDNTIMETLSMGDHKENMVTMYHLDNGNTMMTHYCSMGNQPRMKLNKSKSTTDKLSFTFYDATNLKSKKDPHMHNLKLLFKDKDHFSQEWTMAGGGKEQKSVFNFERTN